MKLVANDDLYCILFGWFRYVSRVFFSMNMPNKKCFFFIKMSKMDSFSVNTIE